jgi:hypothetical protein
MRCRGELQLTLAVYLARALDNCGPAEADPYIRSREQRLANQRARQPMRNRIHLLRLTR